jgi:hypothetical protein
VMYLILTFRRKLLTTFAEGTKSFLVWEYKVDFPEEIIL